MFETALGLSKFVIKPFNKSFYKRNNSTLNTALYHLMNLFGPADACPEYAQTRHFSVFLKQKGDRNHLMSGRCKRFGKNMETAFLVLYHLE